MIDELKSMLGYINTVSFLCAVYWLLIYSIFGEWGMFLIIIGHPILYLILDNESNSIDDQVD